MSFYQKHIFFCTNQRSNGKKCCQQADAETMCAYAKQRLRSLYLAGEGKVRVSKSGCLGRCDEGPMVLIYPEGTWYNYANQADIEEIIQVHIIEGGVVERLLVDKRE